MGQSTMMNLHTLAEAVFLVSFWKPLILLLPFIGWLWVISKVYDKHAARFFLPRNRWNAIHLSVGLLAIFAALAIPMRGEAAFWIGLGVMVVLLVGDLVAYAVVANRDERVPEEFHIKFDYIFKKMEQAKVKREASRRQGKVELVILGPDKKQLDAPEKESPDFEVRLAAESIMTRAMQIRASQIDLQPTGKDGIYSVSFLVDGVRQVGEALQGALAIKIIDFWKGAAKLDLADRRRKLAGDAYVEHGVDKHKLRIHTSGAQGGMRMTAVLDPEKAVRRKADALGLLDMQFNELKAIVDDRKGVVLVAAPPDMGRTTTLYSFLKMHDAYTSNVQTVEMEPQDALEGVRQNQFETTGEGPEYSTFVRSILRRDPQVVGIGEMPDENTAREIARADHERTRIYLSLKTDNALTAIQAWVKAVGDPDLAAKALHGATAQKLLRKLCINCRVPYQPAPEMLKKLGVPSDKPRQLFKKGGQVLIKNKPEVCPVCSGIGYIGQEGIYEVFRIGPAERELIRAGNFAALRAEFRKRQMPTIQQSALKKALDGVTSVEELLRVTAGGGGAAGSGAPSPVPQPRPTAPASSPATTA
jgi:type II secretory ATPase GspE/PulE/Tfp pilus assembly ATPase PilB-like protein